MTTEVQLFVALSGLYYEMLTKFVPSPVCACNVTVHERILRTCDDFVWPVDTTFVGRFIIDVEFLDLKICPLNVSSCTFKLM